MAAPTPYELSYDFTAFQASNPTTPLPADKLEIEFNALQTTTDEIIANLGIIQRTDGALANQSVGIDQLKPEVSLGFNSVTNWLTGTQYGLRDGVYYQNKVYICVIAHQAGVFATDLAANKWQLIADYDQFIVLATAQANIATAQATIATTQAGNSATSAAAALVSQNTATAQAVIATAQATIATSATTKWNYSSTTTMAAPGTGIYRLNNATIASATSIAISALTADSGNPNLRLFIASWDDSTNTIKGIITFTKVNDPATFAKFNVTGTLTDNTTWLQLTIAYVTGAGTFTNSDQFVVDFNRSGDSAGGDVTGQASSVDNEIALFSGTGGKTIKRATTTGLLKAASGVLSAAVAGTDYYNPGGTDVAVADGGTGRSTNTAYAVVCGGTTNGGAEQSIVSVGTAGQVLTSNGAGALPTFQTSTAVTFQVTTPANTSLSGTAHSLGSTPSRIEAFLVCTTADLGYSVGFKTPLPTSGITPNSPFITGAVVGCDATNVYYRPNNSGIILGTSTGAQGTITQTSWNVIVTAYK